MTQFSVYGTYGSISEGNDYFATRLSVLAWLSSTDDDKTRALFEATRLIDRLNFKGTKLDADQLLQFPRLGDTTVPLDIKIATFEIAIMLLDGVDIQEEVNQVGVTGNKYGGVQTTYDASLPEHRRYGIPSFVAWIHIKPYLRDLTKIVLSRVS